MEAKESMGASLTQVTVDSNDSKLPSFAGNDEKISEQAKELIEQNKLVVFGKTWCPFCLELESTLVRYGLSFMYVKVDQYKNGGAIQKCLAKEYGQKTVPMVFCNGQMLGGCSDLKQLEFDGKFYQTVIDMQGDVRESKALDEGASRALGAAFWFPNVVDNNLIRVNGSVIFLFALLCAIFYEDRQAHFAMGGLFIDFILKVFMGGMGSPLASMCSIPVAIGERFFGLKPNFGAGPPKQFAAFCGVMFSGLAMLFFIVGPQELGLAFSVILAFAAGLEGFLGFCLGCVFFGYAIRFNLLPKELYSIYINSLPDIKYAWHDNNTWMQYKQPETLTKEFKDHGAKTKIDFVSKMKLEEDRRWDFHPVKHLKIGYFFMPLAILTWAFAWALISQESSEPVGQPISETVWHVLAILGAVVFVVMGAIFMLRCVLYPRKIHKEVACPVESNFFVVPLICILMIAMLARTRMDRGGDDGDGDWYTSSNWLPLTLFWIASPLTLLHGIGSLSWLLYRLRDREHITPAIMFPPVASLVAAMAAFVVSPREPDAENSYAELAYVWYGFGMTTMTILLPITFNRVLLDANADPLRHTLNFVWVAALSAASIASSFFAAANLQNFVFDFLARALFFASLAFLAILWIYAVKMFSSPQVHWTQWGIGFPVGAVAMNALVYDSLENSAASNWLVFITITIMSYVAITLMASTVTAVIRRKFLVPEQKWGPMSFMKLSHEAFRRMMPMLQESLETVDVSKASTVKAFVNRMDSFIRYHDIHSKHEDDIIFPTAARWFPGVADVFHQDHEEGHHTLEKIKNAARQLSSALVDDDKSEALDVLKQHLPAFLSAMADHLTREEYNISPIIKRYIPLEGNKDIVRRVWAATPAEDWFFYIPYTMSYLPMFPQRVRFIKTFMWAMPEQAQHLGMMAALGSSPAQWARLADELPDIQPRGATPWCQLFGGWKRYH